MFKELVPSVSPLLKKHIRLGHAGIVDHSVDLSIPDLKKYNKEMDRSKAVEIYTNSHAGVNSTVSTYTSKKDGSTHVYAMSCDVKREGLLRPYASPGRIQ